MPPPVRLLALLVGPALLALLLVGGTVDTDSANVYRERRRALAAAHSDGAVIVFGYREGEGQSGSEAFRQENNFYYLTGVEQPGAALLLEAATADRSYEETLFLPPIRPGEEAWNGSRPAPGSREAARSSGFDRTRSGEELALAVRDAAKRTRRLYTLIPPPSPLEVRRLLPDRRSDLARWAPNAAVRNLLPAIERMRLIKSPEELALIQKAVDASIDAHLAAWKRLRPGLFEYQLVATMSAALIERGSPRMAYPPIVGSGPNSVILHYWRSERMLRPGDVLLADVGGEYGRYAADITRTVPVSGSFTKRQRRIYDIVLGAQQAVIEAVRPGVRLNGPGDESLTALARRYFRKAEKGLERRFPHAVGHNVGLDVHDPPEGDRAPLAPGMVITVEPGLYLPEEELGVRIEDMLVVTENGARVLSERLPRDPDAIERLLSATVAATR